MREMKRGRLWRELVRMTVIQNDKREKKKDY